MTALPGAAAVSGSWSADSSRLAFLDQTGALYTVEVASGAVRKLFTATFEPGRPSWSADGRTIALAAIVPYSARYREGLSKILLVDTVTGAGRYVDPLPSRSLQTRGDDGPVWSPDGTRMAFVVASVLWVVDVHPDGTFAGTPRQVTDEVTDAPSWSGDSSTLLYLNNGRLRLVSARGGRPRAVPLQLTWANTAPRGRTVIRAGRLWDGVSRSVTRDADVVVEGHRIVEVTTRSTADGRVVDARDSVPARDPRDLALPLSGLRVRRGRAGARRGDEPVRLFADGDRARVGVLRRGPDLHRQPGDTDAHPVRRGRAPG
ncbi:hypothetical protein Acy02nite_61320 [Actinoplanes cyaneus]|uniref:Uncharacterized protein n=1 Tax=Actinoplanes cyaneus TaxID=52696 RepID=A0A919INH0_9ACTN|nr:PD40 domain-containing protein [Actinoplanes cyaneus]GID68251.1 hypothetical protein Acy02nite_61320 [Actinoplanes cyaneus]